MEMNRSVTVLVLAAFLGAVAPAESADEKAPLWSKTPEQIKEIVNLVRAGKNLNPPNWPNGARVAASLSFDVDTETVWLGFIGQSSPSYMSRGEYGARAGMSRVMKLLKKHDISATFFIPAMSMELHPEVVEVLKANPRHEIGFHSYVHENPLGLGPDEERAVYKKAMDVHVKLFGKKPVGFRSAAWDLTPATINIVKEMGFLYESSMMADDRPYELVAQGKPTGLIELPVEWILDDWPFFQITWPTGHVALRNAEDVFSIWRDEFDRAYEEGTTFILTMHPQVIGHGYRMKMLDRLITYIKSKPGVWIATHEEIARYVKQHNGM
jgi:peptidoglycan-N-acetylglucosamine deacetylase